MICLIALCGVLSPLILPDNGEHITLIEIAYARTALFVRVCRGCALRTLSPLRVPPCYPPGFYAITPGGYCSTLVDFPQNVSIKFVQISGIDILLKIAYNIKCREDSNLRTVRTSKG